MLSVFPELLFLAPFSAFLIRLALGLVFAYAAQRHLLQGDMTMRGFAFAEGATAVALILGAWTQPAAVVGALLIGSWFIFPKLRVAALGTALLALVLCATLLLTGAGPFAFDLPL